MIDAAHPDISIARQCELIQLSRASYYRSVDYGPVVETAENLELMRLIDEEYTRHPFMVAGSSAIICVDKGMLLIANESSG